MSGYIEARGGVADDYNTLVGILLGCSKILGVRDCTGKLLVPLVYPRDVWNIRRDEMAVGYDDGIEFLVFLSS